MKVLDTVINAMKFNHWAIEWRKVSLCAKWSHLLSNLLMSEAFPISKKAYQAWVATTVILIEAANHYWSFVELLADKRAAANGWSFKKGILS